MRCQGKGGICPNPVTTMFQEVPGYYCDLCISEVLRVGEVMQSYRKTGRRLSPFSRGGMNAVQFPVYQ